MGICTLSFQDSALDLYYQYTGLHSDPTCFTFGWCYATPRETHVWLPGATTHIAITMKTLQSECWNMLRAQLYCSWPPTVLQSLSPLYNSHQIPPTLYFIFFQTRSFQQDLSGRSNVTVICGETLSSWESDYLTISISLLQNCSELFPLWSNPESVANRHRWGCQENLKCWYSHVQTMTHSGEVSSVDQQSLGWQFCHQECCVLACANISNIYVTYMIKNQTKGL